jgi:hypothetical protein
MITDLIERAVIRGERLNAEDRTILLDWFARADQSAAAVNPSTGKVSNITQTDINAMVDRAISAGLSSFFPRLSDVSTIMGTVVAGEFRTGNFKAPGDGFTGGRFGYPGFSYGGSDYFLAGVSNDVLQIGLSLTDGKLYAGAGAVVLGATSSTIGGWVIDADSITADTGTVGMSSATTFGSGDDIRFFAGLSDPEDLASGPFWVDANGNLRADSATITGTITAEDGSIGGWAIETNRLWSDPLGDGGIYLYSDAKKIQVGNVAGTHIVIDGSAANQYIRSSNFVTGASGFNISASTGDAEFNNITARGELKTFLFSSSNQMAVAGNIIVSQDAGKLGANVTAIATTVNFGKAMTPSDWVKIQGPDSAGSNALEWMLVGTLVSGTTYNVTRNVDGSGANAWLKDTPFVVIGASGDSRIELTAGASGSIQLITQGATWNTQTVQVSLSTASGTMTAGAGDVTIDQFGIVFRNQEANLSFEDTSNNINTLYIYSDGGDELVLKNAVGGKAIRLDIDDASHNVGGPSFTYDGIFFGNDNDSNEFQISNKAGTPTFFNGGGVDIDTYIETDNNPFAFYLDGGLDKATSFAWDGWQSMGYQTWTRTGNHVFTVSGDVTAVYRKSAKVRYKDGGSYEYGVIASSSHSAGTTTVNLVPNTDYAMAAATITDNYLSYIEDPEGFPYEFNYTVTWTNITVGNGTVTSKWKAIHGEMFYMISLVWGSTTSCAGAVSFSLAATSGTTGGILGQGWVRMVDASAATAYPGQTGIGSAATTGNVVRFNETGTFVTQSAINATAPFTWTTSDELHIKGNYSF